MKNYIDFSMDVASNAVQKSFIQQEYKENIVFQWLKRPCLICGKNSKVLSQESLFYICFRLLDTLKQCDDLTDCQVQSEMQCVPYEIERLIPESIYDNSYYCASERMFAIFTLHTLLCMLETDEAANTFTVSIAENTGMVNLEDKVCVTYGGEMIYLSLLQISNYFSVSPGKDVGGGIYKYTVGDDGISTYTGTIVNPGTGSVSVTWVSGS